MVLSPRVSDQPKVIYHCCCPSCLPVSFVGRFLSRRWIEAWSSGLPPPGVTMAPGHCRMTRLVKVGPVHLASSTGSGTWPLLGKHLQE